MLPEISKPHYMIFEGERSAHREHQNTQVQQHQRTHWANQTPHYRLIDGQPATAHTNHTVTANVTVSCSQMTVLTSHSAISA
jgi:hypothetical protein